MSPRRGCRSGPTGSLCAPSGELALRAVVAERAVVGREDLEHARLQPQPAGLLARFVAGGGVHTYLAPSMLRPSMSFSVSTRYCGQVSPNTFRPLVRAQRISSIASRWRHARS